MGYTGEQAKLELQKILSGEKPATLDELNKIISDLDVTDTKADVNAKTILYSAMDEDTLTNLAKDSKNRMLNNTEAFKFLDKINENDTFAKAWKKITGSEPDWDPVNYSGEVDKFIGGVDGNPRTPE